MFNVPNFETIRESILRDILSLNPNADISPDSDNYIRAASLASLASGQYAHQSWLVRQIFPDTADSDFLIKHAALRGLTKRRATSSSGTAFIQGVSGAIIDSHVVLLTNDNRFFETTEAIELDTSGQGIIKVRSQATGNAQNITQQTAAQFMSAPKGVQSQCYLNDDIRGATDEESDSSLLERLLTHIRRPPAGGNQYDYKNWALSCDGVTAAFVYPLRRGLGTVDIAITSENDIPSQAIIENTQAYIDDRRPVTAKEARVIKPDVTTINFELRVALDGMSLTQAEMAIKTTLKNYFDGLTPAQPLIISQCEALVSDVIGIIDRQFINPKQNHYPDIVKKVEWFRLGKVVVSEMLS